MFDKFIMSFFKSKTDDSSLFILKTEVDGNSFEWKVDTTAKISSLIDNILPTFGFPTATVYTNFRGRGEVKLMDVKY